MLYANNTPIGTAAKCCGLRASSDGAEGEAVELGLDMLRRQLEQPRHGKTSVGVATDSLSLLMALGAGPTRVTDGMLRCIGAQLHGLLTGLVVTGRRRQVQHPPKPRTTRCGPRRQATLLARLRTSTCPHFGFLQRQDGAQTVCRPPTLLALWCPQPRQRLDPHPLSAVRAADPALCRACDGRLAGCSRRKAHLVPRYDAARTGVMTHMLTHGSVPPSRRMWANPFRLAATTSTEMEEDARHPDSCGTGAGSMAYGRVAEALKGSHRRLADLFLELIRHAVMYTERDSYAPTKVMTEEELQRSVDRLSRSNRLTVELKPLAPRSIITKEALDKRIHHLYDESLERRQREREEVARQMDAAIKKDATITVTKITPLQEEALVRHLYDETLATKKRNFDELYKQSTSHYERNTIKLTAKKQLAAMDRLYREGMERERNKHIALYEKYVVARQPPPPRRTAAELAASADKMTRGEGLTS
ncbi:hypothetical protein CGC21_15040 [Leishmania donovani]|nr:hypothetical protein CGC21_15040 [Leishmania donovani]